MKQSTLVTILLVVLMVGGWGTAVLAMGSEESNAYNEHIETAEDYANRGLYQKAIAEYDAALAIESSEDVWTAKLSAYAKRYEESDDIYNDYISALQNAVSSYSQNAEYLLTLTNLYLQDEEYVSAYEVLNNAVQGGMKNEEVSALLFDAKYAFELELDVYSDYIPCTNGYYVVCSEDTWNYIEADGSGTDFGSYVYASPVGESGIRVVQDERRSQLIDGERVVQGILQFDPKSAGVYAEGLVPIKNGASFAYYNSLGDKQFGEYDAAGAFTNGTAAVQEDGEWYLIDNEGNEISGERYEDIVLQSDDSHIKNGIMIAKKDGSYKFYRDGNAIGSYEDAGILTDDNMVAVCIDGKWGFVDTDANELIAPQFSEAKSFSNGLAAVSNGEKWGFIDTNGEVAIDYQFLDADYFNSGGHCLVETEQGQWQMISLYVAP